MNSPAHTPYVITGRRRAEEIAREQARSASLNMWLVLIVGAFCLASIIGAASWSAPRVNSDVEQDGRV